MPNGYPMLKALDEGIDFALNGRLITIGASKECGMRLSGKGLPERMGHFLFREGRYYLHSLSSGAQFNLNGKLIRDQAALNHGDLLDIQGYHYRYLENPASDTATPPSRLEDETTLAGDPFKAIIRTVVQILRNKDTDVFSSLVTCVSRLLACDAARIVEESEAGERRTLARYPASMSLERFSNRAIDWAKSSDKTILMQEVDWGEQNSVSSLRKNSVSSVLCAALRGEGVIIGYLYMDRMQSGNPFQEKDRELCDSLSPLFAEILANRRELERQKETIALLQTAGLGPKNGIIHASKPMGELMELAGRVARTNATVLIHGETGTGKELLAKFIHQNSQRADKPFVAINCGAIPANLVESELFGHEKGSFTGADHRKIGLFENAHLGTIFLDEIGDLPLALQVKLLRVLQESEISRIGNPNPIPIDARILAATHRDLNLEIKEGRFRQDLFFRLSVLELTLPPLRDRGQDVLLLSDYLIKKYCQQFGLPPKNLSVSARNKLLTYAFPGNIRELENIIQKSILASDSKLIGPAELQWETKTNDNGAVPMVLPTLKEVRMLADKDAISSALTRTSGNISLAAKMLDIDRKWLMKLMDEVGLRADDYRK